MVRRLCGKDSRFLRVQRLERVRRGLRRVRAERRMVDARDPHRLRSHSRSRPLVHNSRDEVHVQVRKRNMRKDRCSAELTVVTCNRPLGLTGPHIKSECRK